MALVLWQAGASHFAVALRAARQHQQTCMHDRGMHERMLNLPRGSQKQILPCRTSMKTYRRNLSANEAVRIVPKKCVGYCLALIYSIPKERRESITAKLQLITQFHQLPHVITWQDERPEADNGCPHGSHEVWRSPHTSVCLFHPLDGKGLREFSQRKIFFLNIS